MLSKQTVAGYKFMQLVRSAENAEVGFSGCVVSPVPLTRLIDNLIEKIVRIFYLKCQK